jgi:hypothetical protein
MGSFSWSNLEHSFPRRRPETPVYLRMLPMVRAFCLRGMTESIFLIGDIVPISSGFEAPAWILGEVNFINASGLVRSVAIRRKRQPSLAFFERPEGIRA